MIRSASAPAACLRLAGVRTELLIGPALIVPAVTGADPCAVRCAGTASPGAVRITNRGGRPVSGRPSAAESLRLAWRYSSAVAGCRKWVCLASSAPRPHTPCECPTALTRSPVGMSEFRIHRHAAEGVVLDRVRRPVTEQFRIHLRIDLPHGMRLLRLVLRTATPPAR